jgi:hypothetical protein
VLQTARPDYFVCGLAPVDDEPEAPPDVDDEPLGVDDEDDPLGDEALEDEPLGDDDDAPDDEDEPLGDAAGLDEVSALACTPSFDAVSLSRRPVAFRPSFCW